MVNDNIVEQLNTVSQLKPPELIVDDLSWKFMARSIYRGKNILIVGPTRSGKTFFAKQAAKALGRNDRFYYFNLGSTQDARATLIGNTVFETDKGTMFCESEFVKAIQTPNAVILLDELSRGHHDAWNILMSVTDPTQKYLRLDERKDSAIVKVADGVSFIATANIGNEYTSTRVMDKALLGRFPVIIEMELLSSDGEFNLLKTLYPDIPVDSPLLSQFETLCDISYDTKKQCKMDDSKINDFVSTGTVVEMAELLIDGFTLDEVVKMVIYPLYPTDGGSESERVYIKQLVQKRIQLDFSKSQLLTNPSVKSKKIKF